MAKRKLKNITGTAASLSDPAISDARLIKHLASTASKNILEITGEGLIQTEGLYEKGIWVCECCRHLNPLEIYHCKRCRETRLIIRK